MSSSSSLVDLFWEESSAEGDCEEKTESCSQIHSSIPWFSLVDNDCASETAASADSEQDDQPATTTSRRLRFVNGVLFRPSECCKEKETITVAVMV